MKKTAHQVWKDAQQQNLNAQQFKDVLIKEKIIIPKNKNYYLCSQAVIDFANPTEVSKPFKSGYEWDDDVYYVALIDFENVEKHYNEVIQPFNEKSAEPDIDFWCRECVSGTMEDALISLKKANEKGFFVEIENKLNLTNERNRAMIICNMAQNRGISPVELINKMLET